MRLYRNLKLQTLAIALLFVVVSLVAMQFFATGPVLLVTASLAVVGINWRLYRALHHQFGEQLNQYRQLEALTGLYNTLDIRHPLPRMRDFAASPDFLHLLATEIFRIQPKLIVETGSGTSTLIAAYCLRKIGQGRIVSLDHLEIYADQTRQTIESHGLENFARVLHAPLRNYTLDDQAYRWYDDGELHPLDRIDLLIIDGPPKDVSPSARYPAVPLLRDKLHTDTVVLLDDGRRPAEKRIVVLWKERYGLNYSSRPTEKGAFVCSFDR